MKVTNVTVTVVDVPQTKPLAPYRSHYRATSSLQSGIVCVETDAGLSGWGEFNMNFRSDLSGQPFEKPARAWLIGKNPLNIMAFLRDCPLETLIKSALEMALWDIKGKTLGVPVSELLGGVIRPRVEVAACMGIQTYEKSQEFAHWYVELGFSTIKTKAGADMDEDVNMVRGLRDAVGDKLQIRVDPNTGYTLAEAKQLSHRLEEFNLQYWEQPIPAEPLTEATELRRYTRIPIALNESVTDPASVIDIIKADAAAFVLPDTHIAGGIWRCVEIGHVGAAAGLPVIMHCSHDLAPKTAAMLHIAAACPAYSLANDCTYYGIEDDIITQPFQIERGSIAVPTMPGLGFEVDPKKLQRYRVG